MDMHHEFRIGIPVDDAWGILLDLERVAPCMPGAELQEVEGEEYRGVVKVKVGSVTTQYRGAVQFETVDKDERRVVLRAEGRETRGQGKATAVITAQLHADGDATRAELDTDLQITGRVAQFGRGVLQEVSEALLGQFTDALEAEVGGAADAHEPEPAVTPPSHGAARQIVSAPAEPVDLLKVAGPATMKRLAPLGVVAVLALLWWRRRR